ncbi:MAG TPA: hypothetical protein VFD92_00395, partial [Candidatus Binatia bacterium]|nr:hypothetical protein [Candidatus Binatia bacterium]
MGTRNLGLLACALAWGLTLAAPAPAGAQSGTQGTPDGKRALVSKDVGGQRWAISRNPDHTVTGNVFFPGGGAPQFVFCSQTGESDGNVMLSCSGADACPLGPCQPDEWLFIADVTLPLSFFGTSSDAAQTLAVPAMVTPMTPIGTVASAQQHATESAAAGSSASGLQVTPNGALALVSKDVGDQRWAITRNEDGTVTGNVFFPGGGDPKFVWCEPTSDAADPIALRCLGADACVASGAGACGSQWTLIADVSLPASFFQPHTQASPAAVAEAVMAQLGDPGGFDAVALALARGYSIEQIIRAALTARLRSSGEIVARSAATEPPAGPAVDVFTDAAASSQAGSTQSDAVSLDKFLEKIVEVTHNNGVAIVIALLYLVDAGYSIEQIVVELFFSDAVVKSVDNRVRLVGPDGKPITPEGPPRFKLDTCGNGQLDDDEDCEGQSFSRPSICPFGQIATQTCNSACEIASTTCPDVGCGDGHASDFEDCDGNDFKGKTCADFDLGPGQLTCLFCRIETAACGTACAAAGVCCSAGEKRCGDGCIPAGDACCGDGVRQGSEACDGADLGGASCASVGQGSGALACSGFCTFDTSGCHGGCPDGTFACEGGCAPTGSDCCEGERGYCSPGSVCVGDLQCCPSSLPQRCGNTCNAPGSSCCGNGVKEPG